MIKVVADILKSIFRSLFISVVLFVIVYSVITQEFPPDFGRIKSGYERLKEFQALANDVMTLRKNKQSSSASEDSLRVDEDEIQRLIEIQKKRSAIGEVLTDPKGLKKSASAHQQTEEISPEVETAQDVAKLRREVEILKARILTLEDQMHDLNRDTSK